MIAYQVKERNAPGASEEEERKWFENKVLKKAKTQVRNTLDFLEKYPEINIVNQRGHTFNVGAASLQHIIKLIIYSPGENFPEDLLHTRHYESRTAGFMHIVPWDDYANLCARLITPAELVEYFEFREALIKNWSSTQQVPSEPAILGQFLRGEDDATPSEEYAMFAFALKQDYAEFDISPILSGIGDRIAYFEGMDNELGYYKILAEFAKLNRADLKLAKERIVLCEEAARADRVLGPTCFISHRTDCGFMFVACDRYLLENRYEYLKKLTEHAKYKYRLSRQVGVSFAKQESIIHIDWSLLDYPWEEDSDLEDNLKRWDPFPNLKAAITARYKFDE